ncbi:hypothetical protein BGW80DRAFT_54258 [Lactifluus volemus]|nr:hypothetical protein BGW80DRAFT_54258 [Lactifluus volemus]
MFLGQVNLAFLGHCAVLGHTRRFHITPSLQGSRRCSGTRYATFVDQVRPVVRGASKLGLDRLHVASCNYHLYVHSESMRPHPPSLAAANYQFPTLPFGPIISDNKLVLRTANFYRSILSYSALVSTLFQGLEANLVSERVAHYQFYGPGLLRLSQEPSNPTRTQGLVESPTTSTFAALDGGRSDNGIVR